MEKGLISHQRTVCAKTQGFRRRGLNILLAISLLGIVMVCAVGATPDDDSGFERFRVIAERSIFAKSPCAIADVADRESDVAADATTVDIRLVGVVKASDPLLSIAIVEEGGRHRLCHIGDEIGTLILRSIRDHDIVFESPAGHWLAEIEPGTILQRGVVPQIRPSADGFVQAPQPVVTGSRRRLPVRAVDIRQLAKAGLVAHTENGMVRGLRLTHDAFGLKEGDRVTSVDGQALCTARPKQKLWQIVRKHSASKERVQGIPVVVERNNQTLEFLVAPIG